MTPKRNPWPKEPAYCECAIGGYEPSPWHCKCGRWKPSGDALCAVCASAMVKELLTLDEQWAAYWSEVA